MSQRQSRRTFEIFVVEEGRDGKNWWNKVGGGFENQDRSMSLRLHLFPDLLLQVREYVPRDERGEGRRDERRNDSRRDDRNGRGRRGRRGGHDRGYSRNDRDDGPPPDDDPGPDEGPDDYQPPRDTAVRGAPIDDDIPF